DDLAALAFALAAAAEVEPQHGVALRRQVLGLAGDARALFVAAKAVQQQEAGRALAFLPAIRAVQDARDGQPVRRKGHMFSHAPIIGRLPMVVLSADSERRLITDILQALHVPEPAAASVANDLVEADLRG